MDWVKVPEHTESGGATISARSNLLDGLRPALMPDAVKPRGAVIPPGIKDHVDDSKRPKSMPEKVSFLLFCDIF